MTPCVAEHRTDPDRPRAAAVGLLCDGHWRGLLEQVDGAPGLHEVLLSAHLTSGTRSGGSRPKPGSKVLISEPVTDARTLLRDTLAAWLRIIAEERQLAGLPAAHDVPAVARLLGVHLRWAAGQPWADELADEIGHAYRAARAVAYPSGGRTRRLAACLTVVACDVPTRLPLVCPGTIVARVVVDPAAHFDTERIDALWCSGCGRDVDMRTEARSRDTALDVLHLSLMLGLDHRRLRVLVDTWASRGRIVQVGRDPVTYRLGEVAALLSASARRSVA